MNWYECLEDFLYGWVRRNAPQTSREALDELIDNVIDLQADKLAGVYAPSRDNRRVSTMPVEVLRGWASLD